MSVSVSVSVHVSVCVSLCVSDNDVHMSTIHMVADKWVATFGMIKIMRNRLVPIMLLNYLCTCHALEQCSRFLPIMLKLYSINSMFLFSYPT